MSATYTFTVKYTAGRKTAGRGTGMGWCVFAAAGRNCATQQRNHDEDVT
jgi:hypothetical protein